MPKVVLTGDSTLSGVARAVEKKLSESASGWVVTASGFNSWIQDVLDPESFVLQERPDFLVVVLSPRLVTDLPDLEGQVKRFLAALRSTDGAIRVLCTTLAVHPMLPQPLLREIQLQELADRINQLFLEFGRQNAWFSLVSLQSFLAEHGLGAVHDPRYEMIGRLYFSPRGATLLADRLARSLLALCRPPCKVLALDLDNTVWGGVIGEDGMDGIKIGAEGLGYAFSRFQRALLDLKRDGVLLAVCSKNDEAEALKVFREHPDMVLKLEDIAAHRINWLPKSENLKSLAEELNLGLDSFVFMDDSPFEREEMRQSLPAVKVIDTPEDPADYVLALARFPGFDVFRLTEEDRARAQQYVDDRRRHVLKSQSLSLEDFYRSLNMKATIAPADESSVGRVHQLIGKTNQFNLTTKRYHENELRRMLNSATYEILTLRLRDKFGESGLTGVAVIRKSTPEWEIENLLMSCRILGRTVEFAFLHEIVERARRDGARTLKASFVASGRNKVAENYLARAGFTPPTPPGTWSLGLTRAESRLPAFYVEIEGVTVQ